MLLSSRHKAQFQTHAAEGRVPACPRLKKKKKKSQLSCRTSRHKVNWEWSGTVCRKAAQHLDKCATQANSIKHAKMSSSYAGWTLDINPRESVTTISDGPASKAEPLLVWFFTGFEWIKWSRKSDTVTEFCITCRSVPESNPLFW